MTTHDSYDSITVDVENDVAYVEFHKPKKYNPLDTEVMLDLDRAFNRISVSREIQAVVITGEGEKSFSSGGDIREYAGPAEAHDPEEKIKQKLYFQVWQKLYYCHAPVIAKINGYCVGGGLILASYCDLAIAVDDAKFGVPTCDIGQIPGDGATYRLSQLIGERKTKELVYTADLISAKEAHRLGIVNNVVPRSELDEETAELVRKILETGTSAVKNSKRAINYSVNSNDIHDAQEHELTVWWEQFSTDEREALVDAFLDD